MKMLMVRCFVVFTCVRSQPLLLHTCVRVHASFCLSVRESVVCLEHAVHAHMHVRMHARGDSGSVVLTLLICVWAFVVL